MSGRPTALGILAAVLATAVGCGRSEAPTPKPAVITAWQQASTKRRGYEVTPPYYFSAQAPAVRDPGLGWSTRWPRRAMLTLYEPDGVWGSYIMCGTVLDPLAASASEPVDIVRGLRWDLDRQGSVGTALVAFAADRRVPWARVDRWLTELGLGRLGVEAVSLRYRGPIVRLSPVAGRLDPEIHVDVIPGAGSPFVRIRDATSTYDFPAGAPYDGEARLALANRHWAAIFANLEARAARGPMTLGLAIDAVAPWSHVLQLLSLAAAAGIDGVSVEGSKVSIRLATHPSDLSSIPPRDSIASGRPFGRPAWMFLATGIAAAMGLGALLRFGPGMRAPRDR